MNKKEICKIHLENRMKMSLSEVDKLSTKINQKISSIVENLSNVFKIGLFYPFKNEVNVLNLREKLGNDKFKFLLPKVIDKGLPLKYYSYSKNYHSLKKGFGGVMEPIGKKSEDPDILIASCSAFNQDGFRVGYGGGFFDRTINELRKKKDIKIILAAFELQKTNIQFQESFDEKVDYICTENKTYII